MVVGVCINRLTNQVKLIERTATEELLKEKEFLIDRLAKFFMKELQDQKIMEDLKAWED